MRVSTGLVAVIVATSLGSATSFSPWALPSVPLFQGTTCGLRRMIPLNSVHAVKFGKHLVSLKSGKTSSNAEQADLNFNLWDAAKNGEVDKIERCWLRLTISRAAGIIPIIKNSISFSRIARQDLSYGGKQSRNSHILHRWESGDHQWIRLLAQRMDSGFL